MKIPDKLIQDLLPILDFTDLKMALVLSAGKRGFTQRELQKLTGQSTGSICERLHAWEAMGFVEECSFIDIDKSAPSKICAACKMAYPFLDDHHMVQRSQGGDDNPSNIAKLCPNCHRLAHRSIWLLTARGCEWLGLEEIDNASEDL